MTPVETKHIIEQAEHGQDFVINGVVYRKVWLTRAYLYAHNTNRCSVGPCPVASRASESRLRLPHNHTRRAGEHCITHPALCGCARPLPPGVWPGVVPVDRIPALAMKGALA